MKSLLTIEDVMKIAEEEIRRTSEEAVKEALLEVGGELAYEKGRARLFEDKSNELELYNKSLQYEIEEIKEKNRKRFIAGAIAGGTGGIIITSLVFTLCSSFIKQTF